MSKYEYVADQLYGNIAMFHPDGRHMGYANKKSADWYVSKDLANWDDNKESIQLTFEPNGMGHAGAHPFYLNPRKNCCVVCGRTDKLTRHHVIPQVYWRRFPTKIKSGMSHDILGMCITCHKKYEDVANELKDKLGEEVGCPVDGVGWYVDLDIKKATGAARTLLGYNGKKKRKFIVPDHVKVKLYEIVKTYLGKSEVTQDDLEYVTSLDEFVRTEEFRHHGDAVVEQIDDYWEFIEMWRQHFLDTMNPTHLPDGWSVGHRQSDVTLHP